MDYAIALFLVMQDTKLLIKQKGLILLFNSIFSEINNYGTIKDDKQDKTKEGEKKDE